MLSDQVVKAARIDPGVFVRAVTGFPIANLHKEWIRHCLSPATEEELANQEDFKICRGIIGPRDHGKTSIVVGLICWSLGQNVNVRIKYVTNVDDKAIEVCQTVEEILETEEYRQTFPEVHKSLSRRWRTDKFYLQRSKIWRDASFEAKSVLSSGTGGRCDILILDDCCDRKNTKTPGLRKSVTDTIWDVWMKTVVRGGRVWNIATLWHKEDFNSECLKNKSFPFLFYAIDEKFTPLWEEVWPEARLRAEFKQKPESFNLGFRMLMRELEDHFIHEDWFKICVDKNLLISPFGIVSPYELKRFFAGVDPAIAKKKKSKYTTIVTIGRDKNGLRILSDIKRGHISSPDQARAIIRTYEIYKHEKILVENNQYQQALIEWIGELRTLPLDAFYTGEQKHDDVIGLNGLAAEFKAGMWRIPDLSGHDLVCECPYCEWIKELTFYPDYPTSDLLMATWLAREALKSFERKSEDVKIAVWRL